MNSTLEDTCLDNSVIQNCVCSIFNRQDIKIKKWEMSALSCRSMNFTTGGVYRVQGTAIVDAQEMHWSTILKIIKQESEEKNNIQHHNYWKREIMVNKSGILNSIPKNINTPKCYWIEEISNGVAMLFMEEINGNNHSNWSKEDLMFIAKQLGEYQGMYVTGHQQLPDHEWLCKQWLWSWVKGCMKYASDPSVSYPVIKGKSDRVDRIWKMYTYLSGNSNKHFQVLSNLPRVLAHQDLSKQNIFLDKDTEGNKTLTLIDWQFLSISGLGEDLGKLFGVAMSQGDIPIETAWEVQELVYNCYKDGLKDVGWTGDSTLARYGFCVSVAFRSTWEVPKLLNSLANYDFNGDKEEDSKINNLIQTVEIQLKLAVEAEGIITRGLLRH